MVPLTSEQLQLLRRQLLKKGAEINDRLTALLNHERTDLDLDRLLGSGKPGETPIERLRRFVAIIDAALGRIRDGTYGRCSSCGAGLSYEQLQAMSWADTCPACAAQGCAAT
jgi:RNA polymerase-binding transcription factor DksA